MVHVGIKMGAREHLLASCTEAYRALFSTASAMPDWEYFILGLTKGRTHPISESWSELCALDVGWWLEYGQD